MAKYKTTLQNLGPLSYLEPINDIQIQGDLAIIDVGAEFPCIIDLCNLPKIFITKRWRPQRHANYPGLVYATASVNGKAALMHRVLLDAPKGLHVDHIDGDGLNNRSENIRLATPSQNSANELAFRNNRVGLRGVYIRKDTGKYKAEISSLGKKWSLGTYDTPNEAAAARRAAEIVLHGSFSAAKR